MTHTQITQKKKAGGPRGGGRRRPGGRRGPSLPATAAALRAGPGLRGGGQRGFLRGIISGGLISNLGLLAVRLILPVFGFSVVAVDSKQ